MTPTRELAFQIAEQFRALGAGMSLKETVIIGGLDMHAQAKALAQRPHVVIATPGRLRGLVESDPTLKRGFARTRFLVLDEADRLLEASFEGELRCIVGMLPAERQTLLFSATMTRSLVALQSAALRDAYHFQAYQGLETAERLRLDYMFTPATSTWPTCWAARGTSNVRSAIIFCSTCKGCALLSLILEELGVAVAALHSHMSQGRRLAALQRFKAGAVPILLATDVASRGLDIPTVDLVVNYDLPILARDYVHRVGRTARAGRSGWSLSFVTQYDVDLVQKIEALIDKQLAAFAMEEAEVLKGITKVYAARRTAALKAAEQSSRDSSNNRTSGNKGRPKKPAATAQEG
ncbi:hypothetical protein WJX72_010498 [[Myrmecia] bisecta]|uniref:Uncharacterized protein n=1 Tax=[Myrmecia] bisecta TaxID=41462 RepID=A0AAW1PUJ7_9CHLO